MEIYEILSPSGREEKMTAYVAEFATALGYKCKCDVFGNLICTKGDSKGVAIECGLDGVCLMKTAETEKGMIKVSVPNQGAVKGLIGKKIKFLNGVSGIVRSDKTEDVEDFDLNIDIGADNKKDAEIAVPMGEFATLVCEKFETEKFIFGNGISAYVPILILLEVMKEVENATFLFTAQRRFAGRGIKALLGAYEAKTVVSVDTLSEKDNIKCGKGAVVIVKEKGAVPTVSVRGELISSAEGNIQLGATEESLYLDLPVLYGKGAYSGGVCVAVRDKNGSYEGVSKADIDSTKNLLLNYLKRVN